MIRDLHIILESKTEISLVKPVGPASSATRHPHDPGIKAVIIMAAQSARTLPFAAGSDQPQPSRRTANKTGRPLPHNPAKFPCGGRNGRLPFVGDCPCHSVGPSASAPDIRRRNTVDV